MPGVVPVAKMRMRALVLAFVSVALRLRCCLGFSLDENDMQLREGEDVNAAVERVMQKMMVDHQKTKHKKLHERRQKMQEEDRFKPIARAAPPKDVVETTHQGEQDDDELDDDVQLDEAGTKNADAAAREDEDASLYTRATAYEESGEYFRNYELAETHKIMVTDKYRTDQYLKALQRAGVKGKIVVDFGCGSGVLSILAARLGADHTYCVERSRVRVQAKQVIAKNGFADRITVVASVNEIEPKSADVLVSEWMGHGLLTDVVIGDFFDARDRVLKEDTGVLIPSKGRIYAQPVSDPAWWRDNVAWGTDNDYGIDFSPLSLYTRSNTTTTPIRFAHFGVFQNQKFYGGKKAAICTIDFEADSYDADWECGRRTRREHKFPEPVPDDWHGFLITWDVTLYSDVTLDTSNPTHYTHWGHLFWPRPLDTDIGNGKLEDKLELSASFKRANLYHHDLQFRYYYQNHGEEVVLREPEFSADTVATEDAFQNKRLYTAMLAAKAKKRTEAKQDAIEGKKNRVDL
ncbi:unnamed protein product [Amoebophrya sp. A120]|nr:unnamed protein product [Amoebophrya sp. A120]CAD7940800.1 unnamed protein product [Amoebophrya sp. A120]|eukprot:GSA120T00002558001.1